MTCSQDDILPSSDTFCFFCFFWHRQACGVLEKAFFASAPLDALFSIATRNHVTVSDPHLEIIVVSSVSMLSNAGFSLAHFSAGSEARGSPRYFGSIFLCDALLF